MKWAARPVHKAPHKPVLTVRLLDAGRRFRRAAPFGFHASNQPVAKAQNDGSGLSGNSDGPSVNVTNVPPGRYYVSVLPYSGYSIGGAPVNVLPNAQDPDQTLDNITVFVEQNPIPTAQIALFLFEDNYPLNGAPDLPEEETVPGPGAVDWTQFSIVLEEPAGQYGQNGGPVLQDAFGNQLGTTYDADGNVVAQGDGTLHPDENGYLLIRNLAPAKYGIIVVPPAASPEWQQTSTIEGSPVIDAWVKANEPPFFVEFGLPGPHVFVGFVQPFTDTDVLSGGAAVTGTITDMHMSRPPNFQFFSGRPFPGCWVALNESGLLPGRAVHAQPCDGNSGFSIAGVPDGNYEMKVFDANLDVVIATLPLNVTNGTCNGLAGCNLDEVPVFNWFARLNTGVFNDENQDGFWDTGEGLVGPEGGPVAIRWRDGTVYQTFPTDGEGLAPFDEVFPFFHWLVAEVGFTNKKATGATFVVDAGGPVDMTTNAFPGFGELNPQVQADSLLYRTETGPVLTQAFQAFLGQTNVLLFGKAEYLDYDRTDPFPFNWTYVGENGGISGIVHYATTRAEDDPRFAAAETWEPGVPRVQVALYADGDIDCDTNPAAGVWPDGDCDIDWNGDGIRQPNLGVIISLDDVDNDGDGNLYDLADVDNHPLGWGNPDCVNDPAIPGNECNLGNEDIDRNGDGVFDYGDALQITWSDSWDDNLPTDCQGANNIDIDLDRAITADENARCFDGMRNFNQVRPGVFDGGYAFSEYNLANPDLRLEIVAKLATFYANRQGLAATLPDTWIIPSDYIVEAATPPGYKLVKEEDKNVDFGDDYVPSTQALDAVCVGDPRAVPPFKSFTTADGSGEILLAGYDATEAAAPHAGEMRPLCDRKAVPLSAAQNAAANFFLMTDVPIAANATGVVLNDLANEFNPNSPAFGEKYAPPYVPVAFYDWNGKLVNRVHADEFGRYNALLPSSYTVNLPMPSGISPNMLVSCMNDAGPIPNPELATNPNAPETIIDPHFNAQYSQFCYTFQYMPGSTTYLDTPVVSIAAFANPPTFPVDCEREDLTPMIASVNRRNNSGGGGPFVVAGQQIRIRSMGGSVEVVNPDWDGTPSTPKNITRNYNFGGQQGLVHLEDADGNRTALNVVNWNGTRIFAQVPANLTPGDYQVIVTRTGGVPAPGVESPLGVTLTVGVNVGGTDYGVRPNSDGAPYGMDELYNVLAVGNGGFDTIQAAIDFADPGDLVLVAPGTYDELVIMSKPVKLQGWGAGAVTLNARQVPTEKIADWRAKVEQLVDVEIDLLPGQVNAPTGFPALGAPLFPTEEGAGIFVAGLDGGLRSFRNQANRGARIDGFTIVGATQGGGVVVNGYAGWMNIGNNRLTSNAGFYGGGIRVGHPTLSHEDADTNALVYDDALNDQIRIHHNHIVKNGSINNQGVGGGIGLHTGADNYKVQKNWVCGNFTQGSGAGIGHLGFSNGGLIEDNSVIFNESFSQASAESGGGIYVGGQPGLQEIDGYLVSPGTGTVRIDANRIRGNLAGAGDGGGIRIENVNGEDILASLDDTGPWRDLFVFNNMITNNVAGLAGGGVSIENALHVVMRSNTVANNDSTATTALAGSINANITNPQPAGIVSRGHTGDLGLLMTEVIDPGLPTDWLTFSDPTLIGNIVYQNRSFFWLNGDPATVTSTGLYPASCYPDACDPAAQAVDAYTVDLAVLPEGIGQLDPRRSLLTDTTGYHGSNITGDPAFVMPYFNGPRDNLNIPEFTTLQTAGAFDEGGNFIQVTYGPLTLDGYEYHITGGSAAVNQGGNPGPVSEDFDNDARSNPAEIGADEL